MRCSRCDKSKCVLRGFCTDCGGRSKASFPMLIYVYETLLVTGGIDHEYKQLKWVLLCTCLASQFHKEQNFGQNQNSGGDFALHQSGNTGIPLWTWRIWMREQIKLEATESHNNSALWLRSRLRDEIKTVTVFILKKSSCNSRVVFVWFVFLTWLWKNFGPLLFPVLLYFGYFYFRYCHSHSIRWKSGFWLGHCNTLQLSVKINLLWINCIGDHCCIMTEFGPSFSWQPNVWIQITWSTEKCIVSHEVIL